ncbi:MAG: alanine racemase [Bacteroidota bacterium]
MTDFTGIAQPTLLLDERKCKANIACMAEKAKAANVIFRPHFKTHQSHEIGRWYRDAGVRCITVSSVKMAEYFANDGWEDITIAFPVNIREASTINLLAKKTKLNILIASSDNLENIRGAIDSGVSFFIKIDSGYHRTGFNPENISEIKECIHTLSDGGKMRFAGFLTHSGHTYHAKSKNEIAAIHTNTLHIFSALRKTFPDTEIIFSLGDTPSCSLAESFAGADEIRPGNFVFYDAQQLMLGSCREEQIAVCMACPVVAQHAERNEMIIYGGAVHFSKDKVTLPNGESVFGLCATINENGWEIIPDAYLVAVSQEHGIIRMPASGFSSYRSGSLIGVIPAHACLTADLMKAFQTTEGKKISMAGYL